MSWQTEHQYLVLREVATKNKHGIRALGPGIDDPGPVAKAFCGVENHGNNTILYIGNRANGGDSAIDALRAKRLRSRKHSQPNESGRLVIRDAFSRRCRARQ